MQPSEPLTLSLLKHGLIQPHGHRIDVPVKTAGCSHNCSRENEIDEADRKPYR
jgi:hypothetical protein